MFDCLHTTKHTICKRCQPSADEIHQQDEQTNASESIPFFFNPYWLAFSLDCTHCLAAHLCIFDMVHICLPSTFHSIAECNCGLSMHFHHLQHHHHHRRINIHIFKYIPWLCCFLNSWDRDVIFTYESECTSSELQCVVCIENGSSPQIEMWDFDKRLSCRKRLVKK